ncbi:MAG: hypothetical protein H0U95_19480 [Bacteroidetes bacterium]|nr:hypothetical protein [Bacteroidota bacterium]
MHDIKKYFSPLIKALKELSIDCVFKNESLVVSSKENTVSISFNSNDLNKNTSTVTVPIDHIISRHEKIIPIILSKLNLNKTIFARNCIVQKIDKTTAKYFFDKWHFFGSTTSAYNYGLFYKNELVGAASFSKGRSMNRLAIGKQSFELIRFCCKSGITVTGGLSKLMKHFYDEKKAGDIMTYVDKQFSNGDSFIKAGFKKHSDTPPLSFLVNKKTFKRTLLKNKDENFDATLFYRVENLGNAKMIYTPNEK